MIKVSYYNFFFYYLWYYYNIYFWIFSYSIISCSVMWFYWLKSYLIDHFFKCFILFWFNIIVNIYIYYHWSISCIFNVFKLIKHLTSFCLLFSIFCMHCTNDIVMYCILLILYFYSYCCLLLIIKYVHCLLCWYFLVLNYCCSFSIMYIFIFTVLSWIILTYFPFGAIYFWFFRCTSCFDKSIYFIFFHKLSDIIMFC